MLRRRDGARMTLARPRSATDVAPLIAAGAEEAVRLTDPYVLASYYIEQELPGPEFPKTSEALQHVIDTRPDEAPWARNLQGLLLLNRYENDAALDALRRGFEADPLLQSPVSEEFMTALIRTGRTAEALRIVDAATAKRLNAAQRTRIAWCNVMLGRHRVALRQFRRVLATHREHAYAMLGRAVCLARLHRPREALPVLEKFFRVRGPGWTGVQVYVGALLEVGRTDDAVRAAEDLYARHPDESAAMATLARIRLQQGRPAEAAVLAEAGTRRWAMRALSWYCWGEALLAQGDAVGAIAKFRQLYQQELPAPDCVTGWARALLAFGRNDEALAKFAEASRIDPEDARNYLEWGRALKSLERAGEGDAMIAKAQVLAKSQGLKL